MSSKIKFKVGNTVKLKCGGPEMSVSLIIKDLDKKETGFYQCQWFAGKKLDSGRFPFESLILVEESK